MAKKPLNDTPRGARDHAVGQWQRERQMAVVTDHLAEEVPIALVYNEVSYAVMMATPLDLVAFGYGFSFSEGLISQPQEIYSIDVVHHDHGIELMLRVSARVERVLTERRRQRVGDTGCGICGIEALAQVQQLQQHVPRGKQAKTPHPPVEHAAVQAALQKLADKQVLNAATGAVHAAGWSTLAGELGQVFEDVGRHNALDKLIGQQLLSPTAEPGFVVVSSRASYEMVYKSARAGFSALVAVSGATAQAAQLAAEAGMLLIGFARDGRHVIYTPVV